MDKLLSGIGRIIGAHKIAFGMTVMVLIWPLLILMSPMVLILSVVWIWVALSEIRNPKKK